MKTITEFFDDLLKAPGNKLCPNNTKEEINSLLQTSVKDILFHYLGTDLLNGICVLNKSTNIDQVLFRLLLEGIAPNNLPFLIKELSPEEQSQFPEKYGVKLIGENPKAEPIYLLTKIKTDPLFQNELIRKPAYVFEEMELIGGEEPLNFYCDTYHFLYAAIQQKMLTAEVKLPTILPRDSIEEIAKKIGARKQWLADYEADIAYLGMYSHVPPLYPGDEIEIHFGGLRNPALPIKIEKIEILPEGIFALQDYYLNLKNYGTTFYKSEPELSLQPTNISL